MTAKKEKKKPRAERIDTQCGAAPHMTVDEIIKRLIGKDIDVRCPECGKIHLTPEEASEAAAEKITKTTRYKKIKAEAEGEK